LEREIGSEVDLVFFSCLFDRFLALHPVDFAWDWAGLYLHVSGFRISEESESHPLRRFSLGKSRGSNRLRGLAVLDEGAVDFVTEVSGCDNVVAFPDFSETSCSLDCDVASKLLDFAAGRRVIGIAGHLQPSKGTVTLAQAALRSQQNGRREVFAFIGELWWELYSENDREVLRAAFAGANVFTHFERIPREDDFNAVLRSFDVIYAGYHLFPHSSNMPAKAAGLRRPMIVSEGYLLGDRVSRFRLGKVIPERNVDALLSAIREPLSDEDRARFESGASEYLERHSTTRLSEAMDSMLMAIWGDTYRVRS
jgi:glycosyltransferase involved in cell wall biosynthesis